MKVKKVLLCFFFICISLTTFLTVFAHSGRTDANGGHWNHKTGEYHYHTGEYAGKSNSSSVSKKSESYTTSPQYKPIADASQSKVSASNRNFGSVLFYLVIVVFGLPLVFWIVVWIYESIKKAINDYSETYSPKHKLKKYDTLLTEALSLQEKLNKQAEKLSQSFSEDCIPIEYEIGEDNLPKEKRSSGWGETFTVYKTKFGEKIHFKKGCCGANIEFHILECVNLSGKRTDAFCGICRKSRSMPSCDWYKAHLKRSHLLKELEKTKEEYEFVQSELSEQREKCQKYLQSFRFASKTFELNEKYKTLRNSQQD